MTFKTVTGTLASAVAADGTYTLSYPAAIAPETGTTNAGDFYNALRHRLVMNQAKLVYPDDFSLTFGTSTITVTNKTGATWAADSVWTIQLDQPGKKLYAPKADGEGTAIAIANSARSDVILVSLGAPDILDADGILASQSLNSNSTTASFNGALSSGGKAVLDVARNVVAAWTTTAVLTITGKDVYGNTIVESSASGTTHTGTKAFKEVTAVSTTVNITSLTVGTGDVLGLPVYLPSRAHVLQEIIDGTLAGDSRMIQLPYQINTTDLQAGTVQQLISPVAGRVVANRTVVQASLANELATSVGVLHITVNGSYVTASTTSSYTTAVGGNGSVGDTASVTVPASSSAAAVAVGDVIGVVPSAAWLSSGALNGVVTVAPTGVGIYNSGTFVAGITTAGGSTATTGDVRGTYTPPVAMDGSIVVQLLLTLPDAGRGLDQFTG